MVTRNRKRPLNPFVFPTETDMRFILFAFATVLLVVHISPLVFPWFFPSTPSPDNIDEQLSDYRRYYQDIGVDEKLIIARQILLHNLQPFGLLTAQLIFVFGVAAVFYKLHPVTLKWRRRLMSIPETQDSPFTNSIQSLSKQVGISPCPTIELDRSAQLAAGQVFGFEKKYSIRLNDKMRLLMRKHLDQFNAITLHEMAHIVNRDVGRAYFTQALWGVLLVIIVLYIIFLVIDLGRYLMNYFLGFLIGEFISLPPLFNTLAWVCLVFIQFASTIAFLAAIRASLLRVREFFADWRSALWGAEDGLVAIFEQNASSEKTPRRARHWQLHPPSQERLEILNDPQKLFNVNEDIPFFAGFLLGIAIPVAIRVVITLFNVGTWLNQLAYLPLLEATDSLGEVILSIFVILFGFMVTTVFATVPLTYLAYCVAGILSTQVQRETVAILAMGRKLNINSYLGLFRFALLFSIGYQLGFHLMPLNLLNPLTFFQDRFDSLAAVLLYFAIKSIWGVVFACFIWLWLIHTRILAYTLLGSYAGRLPPNRRRRIITLASCFLMACVIPMMISIELFADARAFDQLYLQVAPLFMEMFRVALPESLFTLMVYLLVVTGVFTTLSFIAFFGSTWLIAWIRFRFQKQQCPNCKRLIDQKVVLGQNCEYCGQDLDTWLLVNPTI